MPIEKINVRLYAFASPRLSQIESCKAQASTGVLAIKVGYTRALFENRLREVNNRGYGGVSDWVPFFYESFHAPNDSELAGIVAEALLVVELLRSGARQVPLLSPDNRVATEIFSIRSDFNFRALQRAVVGTLAKSGLALKRSGQQPSCDLRG